MPQALLARLTGDNLDEALIASAEKAFAIYNLLDGALPVKGYTPHSDWAKVAQLSSYGETVLPTIGIDLSEEKKENIIFALVVIFAHNDILINIETFDFELARKLLADDILTKRLFLPDRFGRVLYDRFYDEFDVVRPEKLSAEEVDRLVSGTDQGVYQINNVVSGPLGILTSPTKRLLYPMLTLPLWHCEDTGCGTLHGVLLERHEGSPYDLADEIQGALHEYEDLSSGWFPLLSSLERRDQSQGGRRVYDLAALVADGLPALDRRDLLKHLLGSSSSKKLRKTLAECNRQLERGDADAVVSRLSSQAQLQLILTLSDREIVSATDEAVAVRALKIPATEIRRANLRTPQISSFDERASLSNLGIRSEKDDPVVYLSGLVWEAFNISKSEEDLAWLCKSNDVNRGTVLNYITQNGVRNAVQKLIIGRRSIYDFVADELWLTSRAEIAEDDLTDQILWKAGFTLSRYENTYKRFRTQLQDLQAAAVSISGIVRDSDRDKLRSVGVNAFVSLERVLEDLVSYSVWVLASDHFVGTRFTYSPSRATQCVSEVLGISTEIDGVSYAWRAEGGNVLGTLMVYARKAANWMTALDDRDSSLVRRPESELPHYLGMTSHEFRFRHVEFWADCSRAELNEYANSFSQIINTFEQSGFAEIRNGLDHYRDADAFPEIDKLIACTARLLAGFEAADHKRFIPKTFFLSEKHEDAFGILSYSLADYNGRTVVLGGPSPVVGQPTARFSHPVLIAPGNLLGTANSGVIFNTREESAYATLWRDYPRRRRPAPASSKAGSGPPNPPPLPGSTSGGF